MSDNVVATGNGDSNRNKNKILCYSTLWAFKHYSVKYKYEDVVFALDLPPLLVSVFFFF